MSILPSNATDIERAIESATADELSTDLSIADITDPDKCSSDLLNYLAYQNKVSYWNESWTENTKRQVIKAAPAINKIKGTKAAVVGALESLGLNFDYQAWYEQEPVAPRGTVNINVDANELDNNPPLNFNDHQNQITAMINANKRGSIHHSVVLCFESLMQRHLGFSEFNSDSMTITVTQ